MAGRVNNRIGSTDAVAPYANRFGNVTQTP